MDYAGFLGTRLAASRKSRVNLSYCDHVVARNRESKSTARLFHAKARRRESWRASVPTSRLPLGFSRGAPGGTSVARPGGVSRRHTGKMPVPHSPAPVLRQQRDRCLPTVVEIHWTRCHRVVYAALIGLVVAQRWVSLQVRACAADVRRPPPCPPRPVPSGW